MVARFDCIGNMTRRILGADRHARIVQQTQNSRIESEPVVRADRESIAQNLVLAKFSGNTFLAQAIQQQNRLRRLLEFGGFANRRRIREWCSEHLAIMDAVVEGDMARSADLMRTHLAHMHGAASKGRSH